ncbi:MAG: hypothetical protein K5771_06620 [Oscillospiraceae bacterium]|nr:hypothetical protein [Oscillospiraceae bacterium]
MSIESRKKQVHTKSIIIALAAIVLCVLLFLSVCVIADLDFAYDALYAVSPEIAQKLKPLREECEDNGIKLKFISSSVNEKGIEIFVSLEDLEEDRIDDTVDLFDSYSVNCPFPASNSCRFVEFDPENREALFLISIRQQDDQVITGDKITISMNRLLSHKRVFKGQIPQIDLVSVCQKSPALQKDDPQIRGYSAPSEWTFDASSFGVLAQMPEMSFSPAQGAEITAAGYVDGLLHIQVHYDDILAYDNHGDVYLTDTDGAEINAVYSISFWDESHEGSYQEYLFDITAEELPAYKLTGYFVTCDTLINGNWQITFPLKH